MKFHQFCSILLLTVTTSTMTAVANASEYFAVEGIAGSLDNPNNDEIDPSGIRLRLGTRLDRDFDIEVQFGFLGDNSTQSFDEINATFAGAYLKGYLPIGFNSALFALGGFTGVELTQEVNGRKFSDNRSGFSYGFGLETKLTENADLTADYMRYIAEDGLFEHFSAVSFGIKLYF